MSTLLNDLNPAQQRAVTTTEGPVLVLAGPGSGKTRVLTHRVAYLIRECGVRPWRIVAVTFTNKAAKEMKSRLVDLLGDADLHSLTIGTFHAICVRLLRREADTLGIDRNFVIYDDSDQQSLIKRAIKALNINDKLYRPRAMHSIISRAKTNLFGPADFEPSTYKEEVARRIYARYQALLAENNAMDFDDLLTRVVWAFRDQPALLQKYQSRYHYILVDEFQDTNTVQYELVRQLSGGHHNLFGVGDEDQCLVTGTLVATENGLKSVESLRPGDRVLAAAGHSSVAHGKIDACPERSYSGPVVVVTTVGGRRLVATPEHCVFGRFQPGGRYHSHHVPQATIRGGSVRKTISFTMFGSKQTKTGGGRWHKRPNDPCHLHELSVCSSALDFRRQVEQVLPIKPHKEQYWQARRTHGDYDRMDETWAALAQATPDARVWKRAKLTEQKYDFMPIGHLLPGALVPVLETDGSIGEDEVVSVTTEQYEGLVYDLSVPIYRNYVAGGIVVHNSIYAFRGANFYNVLRFEKDYSGTTKILLEQNYRSTQNILDVANAVITPNTQRTPKKLFTRREKGRTSTVHEAYDENEEGRWVVRTIQELAEQGVPLEKCAVMYRINAQSRALEDAFLAQNMPYKLVGATRFYARREIKDLMAYLRIIHNPYDTVSLMRIINVPSRKIGAKSLAALTSWATSQGLPLYDALDDLAETTNTPISTAGRRALLRFYDVWKTWIASRDQVSVLALLDQVIEQTGYGAYLRDGSEEGEERWENVLEFRAVASEYSHLPVEECLTTFLEEVSLVSDVDNLDETEAPTLLTLHSAKGLEFGVVFIVGLNDGLLPHSRSFDDPDGMEEERRLFYVGVTRAEDSLYLSHTFRRTVYGSSDLAEPSRFLSDIPSRLKTSVDARQSRQTRMRLGRSWSRSSGPSTRPPARRFDAASEAPVKAGDKVRHPSFGEGTVVQVKRRGGDWDVDVAFEGRGIKTLAASFAKLEKVS